MIQFSHVTFTYDGRSALRDVSLRIAEGEFVAIVGSNASGKSTLVRHMNALLLPEAGDVTVCGMSIHDASCTREIRTCVGMVFQNPNDQITSSLVEDEVAFGPANLGIPRDELRKRVTESLACVGLEGHERTLAHTLSGGQRQRLAIAGALAMAPKALVLDEATAMIDPEGRAAILALCGQLVDQGIAVVMVTHDLEEAARAQRIIVMHSGEIVADGPAREVLSNTDALRTWGLLAPEVEPRATRLPATSASTAPVATFEDVTFSYDAGGKTLTSPVLDQLSLAIREGEFVGIAGKAGSGKSTLIKHLNALLVPTSGAVVVNGASTSSKAGAHAARQAAGLVFQFPETQLFADTVFDDIAYGPRNLGLQPNEVTHRVRDAMASVGLSEDLEKRNPFALSGGQQRLVAIAGILAMQPRILVLDEPMVGLDPMARYQLGTLLEKINTAGTTIVMVSHGFANQIRWCERTVLIEDGHVKADGLPRETLAQQANRFN